MAVTKGKTILRMTTEVINGCPVLLMGPDASNLERYIQDGDELRLAPKSYAELKELCNLEFINDKNEVVWVQVGEPDLTELTSGDVCGRHTIKDQKGVLTEYLCFWQKQTGSKGMYFKRNKMPIEALKAFADMKTIEEAQAEAGLSIAA